MKIKQDNRSIEILTDSDAPDVYVIITEKDGTEEIRAIPVDSFCDAIKNIPCGGEI